MSGAPAVPGVSARPALGRVARAWRRAVGSGVARGLPASWVGYRWLHAQTVQEYFVRHGEGRGRYVTIHGANVASNPLPRNIACRESLPDVRGWWGYSFRDVPSRPGGETFVATIPDCLVTWYRDDAWGGDFYPAILTGDGRTLDLREIRFRARHSDVLRRAPQPARMRRATWILERVYHNHSHWLTAHLPKLLLLRDRGQLADVLLPAERTAAMDASLEMCGLSPGHFRTFDSARPLRVDELTIVGTDRFRPELLQLVPDVCGVNQHTRAGRRVFISRAGSSRRRLLNEEAVWEIAARAGFIRVRMEDLPFAQQVALMRETAVLMAPHGAGLTNMLFCPQGAHVVEFADLSFPNPNFYALAAALRHHYWMVPAQALGDRHPLERDLRVDPQAVADVMDQLPS